jgi:hypothetical protein
MAQTLFRTFTADSEPEIESMIDEWLEADAIKIISHAQSEVMDDETYTITISVFYQFEGDLA